MTIDKKRDFDAVAATWDEQPRRVKLGADITRAISAEVPLNKDMDVMDFGCGTGLLTLNLAPLVRSITGVDSSRGMLDVLGKKVESAVIPNVRMQFVDMDKGDELKGSYDLIVSNMTMHHIKDVGTLIRQFYRLLKPSGSLCITDMDPDGGLFHDTREGLFHDGFERAWMKKAFTDAGFIDVKDKTAATIVKPSVEGVPSEFSVFLVSGRKV